MIQVGIVGTISNVENELANDLEQLGTALADITVSNIFLVESDSTDNTSMLLGKLIDLLQ